MLSQWQYQRGLGADARFTQQESNTLENTVLINNVTKDYQWVNVRGEIIQTFLLDNRVLNQNVGRLLIALVETENQKVLVNLGWQPITQEIKPAFKVPKVINITARTKRPSKGFNLMNISDDPIWPALQQQIDIEALERYLGYSLFPFVLHSQMPTNQWKLFPLVSKNKYAMHMGYSMQWLLLALAGCIMFCFISFTKKKDILSNSVDSKKSK
jgi:cytochrome oxidase assembly protein ShyY1